AVVGGGAGGTASAFFLRQLYGTDVQIDMYEPSNVLCGRVATVEVAGRMYEAGASMLHPSNRYAKGILSKFGLKEATRPNVLISFYNGENYTFRSSEWKIVTLFRLLWTFGYDLIRLYWFERSFLNLFDKIYSEHKHGHSFRNMSDFMYTLGQDTFINATKISACQLYADQGFGSNFINMMLNGGLLANYGQTCEVTGFVGAVSMAGIQPGLWSVRGGNKLLCSKLYENSSAHWIKEEVTKVSLTSGGQFAVRTSTNESNFLWLSIVIYSLYDHVIITTPINKDTSKLDVSGACSTYCPSDDNDQRRYRKTVATFVKGKLNSTKFQCESPTCPVILGTSNATYFRTIGFHYPVDFNESTGDTIESGIYKVFSDESLTKEQIDDLFDKHDSVDEVVWLAYPKYSAPENLTSFVLNEAGLYYTSPIESAASAMEMSLISARNAALLSFNDWYAVSEPVNNAKRNAPTEL
uniref:Prenylcysteine lyase domain-containing protein n=1 Tax=Ciona savignyi TaxID=51511 RepID=H2YKE1_CIOSA